ncbi:ATPase MORC2-like isoform X1 [Saccostrea cucullata]|uniref:ATPase MORC2-like isoform X1 n=1 Tax=Saccostrea cuccullata TaxID=36930 RepID=UPI002ED43807
MTSNSYNALSRAQLSFEYLHTNSTTHEFLFGALAELVDNARDANATRMDIFSEPDEGLRGGYMLFFVDNGEGMDPNETADIITFGRSTKRSLDESHIGMYGNGLKSGSMRIGNDLILFTKKGATMTCLFLSRSFHEEEHIDEVIVPIPSFETNTRNTLVTGAKAKEKHKLEMDIILKYSPFKTEDEFFAQFDKIEGNTGTCVIVYNVKLLDSGDPELDVLSDPTDILLANPESDFDSDEGLMPERKSFRAYTAILYVDPRMKIYIQGKKVRTKKLACCLYKPKMYKYSSNRFKARSEIEHQKAKEEAKQAEAKSREAESKAKFLENKYGDTVTKAQRTELRKAQEHAAEMKRDALLKKQVAERKSKALKDPKLLNFIFGINLENRAHDGVFVYNCSRLIKMYEKVGPQTEGGVYCSGVVGVVDIPYLVLEPTHNKQDFADAKEYRHLLKAMGEHMVQYWKDIGVAQQGVTKFWENFGYISQKWKDPPSQDLKFVRKRAMQINVTLQCDNCLRWRTLPFSSNNIGKDFDDDWVCAMNPDVQHNKCSAIEQKMNIPEGVLKKEVKTKEQKTKDIEEEIKKKQELLQKMNKTKAVTSSRQAAEMERKRREEEERQQREEEERKKKEAEKKKREEKRRREEAERERERREKERLARLEKARKEREKAERERKAREAAVAAKKRAMSPPAAKSKSTVNNSKSKAIRSPTVSQSSMKNPRVTLTNIKHTQNFDGSGEEVVNSVGKRKPPVSSDSEEPPSPAKRSKATSSVDSDSDLVNSNKHKSVETQADDTEDEVPPVKRGRRSAFSNSVADISSCEDDSKVGDNDVGRLSSTDADSDSEIGTKVEVQVSKKWYTGRVVKVNHADKKWKVKFDNNPRDKYDKWFDKGGTDIKLLNVHPVSSESTNHTPPSPASSQDTAAETPSSSTATTAVATSSDQVTEEIANGYRTCLRYFLPPQWIMEKDTITTMTLQELANFPLDDFFDHYEKGLRKLVGNFQTEAAQRKQESDAAVSKLSSVRKLIAKLLKSINEEFDIDPEADGDQVDELLAACVKQAVQSQT